MSPLQPDYGTVTVRIFGSLRPLRTERGLPYTLAVEVPEGGIAARDLAASLGLPPEKIEGVFVNHVMLGIGVHVSPSRPGSIWSSRSTACIGPAIRTRS